MGFGTINDVTSNTVVRKRKAKNYPRNDVPMKWALGDILSGKGARDLTPPALWAHKIIHGKNDIPPPAWWAHQLGYREKKK